jgi:hypothetical protein
MPGLPPYSVSHESRESAKRIATMESQVELTETSNEPSMVQERLNWKIACRDDAKVAQGLYAGEEIEEMHELSNAGLLDEFFVFLEELGMMKGVP